MDKNKKMGVIVGMAMALTVVAVTVFGHWQNAQFKKLSLQKTARLIVKMRHAEIIRGLRYGADPGTAENLFCSDPEGWAAPDGRPFRTLCSITVEDDKPFVTVVAKDAHGRIIARVDGPS